MDMIEIPISLIDEDTDQPRYQFDEEALQELMKSIEELGLLSPIKVRTVNGGRYKIIYGNRRYKVCKTLGRQTIPCIVSTALDDMEIYLEQIAENLTREGFSPIEEAEAFHKLLNDPKFTSSTKYLSSKLGKSEAYIKNKCELLKFGPAVRKLIVSGTEIKQNKLTEDQLTAIKDLAMEHRDPLALIIARDELPVSDVKKIAQLFKDKEMSAGIKDKLLFKTGQQLLETWSVYKHNKAEREKPAEPKAPTKSTRPDKPGPETNPVPPLEGRLRQLHASLPSQSALSIDVIESFEQIDASNRDRFLNDVNRLIEHLENHLTEWKKVRELAQPKNMTAGSAGPI